MGGGGGVERRGLGPRNNVLTTCKVVTLRGGQWIIAVFLEARSEPAEEIRNGLKIEKKISCIFGFLAYRICLSILKLWGKLKHNRVRS